MMMYYYVNEIEGIEIYETVTDEGGEKVYQWVYVSDNKSVNMEFVDMPNKLSRVLKLYNSLIYVYFSDDYNTCKLYLSPTISDVPYSTISLVKGIVHKRK